MSKINASMLSSFSMTVVFASLAALSPLGMDSYLPAVGEFALSLGVSASQASWTLSNFLVGMGLGQLVGGALSDQKGRFPVAIWGLLLYALSCFAIVLLQAFLPALIFRFLQGFAGGLMMVSGVAMLKDTTPPERLAERLSLAIFVVMIMPMVAPILGAAVLIVADWPMIFIMCGSAASLLFVFFVLKVPETHAGAEGKTSLGLAVRQYFYVINFRSHGKRIALVQSFTIALGSSVILVYVTAAPSLFMEHFSLTSTQFPFAFGAMVSAMLIGNRLGRYFLSNMHANTLFIRGLFIQAIIILFLFMLVMLSSPSLLLLVPIMMLSVGAFSAVGPAAQAMYLNLFDKYYGSAAAFEHAVRFALGGVLGGIAVSLPWPLLTSISVVLLCSSVVGLMCFRYTYKYWAQAS